MRDFYPDVFDGLGFLPREYGAVQVFVEPIERDARGHAAAEVWMQACYEPIPSDATLSVLPGDGSLGTELLRLPLPDLSGGRAVRWRIPLAVTLEVERLCFRVSAPEPPGAERVRSNRRQQAGGNGPSVAELGLSQGAGGSDLASAMAQTAALTAIAMPFGYVVGVLPGDGADDQEFVSSPIGLPVEDMPTGFIARVSAGQPEPLDSPALDVMWEPGRPMPRPETAIRRRVGRKEQSVERVCLSCGNRTDSPSASSCPLCGAFF